MKTQYTTLDLDRFTTGLFSPLPISSPPPHLLVRVSIFGNRPEQRREGEL